MRFKLPSSLRVRLLLLVLMAVLPALLFVLYTAAEQRRLTIQRIRAEVERLAGLAAATHGRLVEGARQLLVGLAHYPEVIARDAARCNALFAKLLPHCPQYANFGLIGIDGSTIASALSTTAPKNPKAPKNPNDDFYFGQTLRTRDFVIGHHEIDSITDDPTVNFGYPVIDEKGSVTGVVYAALKLAWFHTITEEVRLPPSAVLTVTDREGVILARSPDPERWVGKKFPDSPLVRAMLKSDGERVRELVGLDGQPRVYASAGLRGAPADSVAVSVGISQDDVLREGQTVLIRGLAFVAAVGIVALIAAWFASDLFVLRKMKRLLTATKRLSSGDLAARTGIPNHEGELGQLAGAFDEMADALQARQLEAVRAATALRESELRHRTLMEQASDGIFVANEQGQYLDVNTKGCEILGYTRDDLLGLNVRDLLTSGDVEGLPERLQELRSGKTVVTERRLVRKDGTLVPVETSAKVLVDGRFQAIVRDITKRKRAEEALQRERSFSELLVTCSMDGILAYDHELRYTVWNPTMESIGGIAKEHVLGRPAVEVFPFLREIGEDENLRAALEGRTVIAVDRPYVNKSGKRGVFEAQYSPIRTASGEIVGGLGIIRDVTERKVLEEQLRLSQKLEALGRLAGGVAHDFNNLLTAILCYSDFVLERMAVDDQLRGEVSEIQKAATRAAMLTNQLLTFSRQRLPPQLEVVEPAAVMSDMEPMLRQLLGEGIEFETSCESGLRVRAGTSQLQQVLLNLVVNAGDAMPGGGLLLVRAEPLTLGEARARGLGLAPGRYVCLEVRDNGCGMSEDVRSHVFEPFFTTKEPGKGTGLGLSTVYGIAKECGGMAVVESELGKGTSVKIYLPGADETAGRGPMAPAERSPAGKETILLAEDESAVRTILRETLESFGYSVLAAEGAEDALRRGREHAGEIQLVVTDVVMPKMTGPALAKELRKDRPGIQVLYISGYTDGAVSARPGPGEGFLQKPFMPKTLARKVRELLDSARVP